MGQSYCDASDCPPKAQSVINRETAELSRLSTLRAKLREELRKKDRNDKEKIKLNINMEEEGTTEEDYELVKDL